MKGPSSSRERFLWLPLLLLVVATLAAYEPACAGALHFTAYDDPCYVSENEHVKTGLSFDNAVWALTSVECANWHPLTWLSLQLDSEIFGARAWGYHLANVV